MSYSRDICVEICRSGQIIGKCVGDKLHTDMSYCEKLHMNTTL